MRLFSSLVIGVSLSFGAMGHAADQKLATVEVTVDDKVAEKSTGIRTLYIIVYDSGMTMPYGAVKVDLKADPKGSIYKGDLTMANLQRMNRDAPVPQNIRLKARLDKDGVAGMDKPGDAVGKHESAKIGDTVKIVINTRIEG